MKTKKQRLEEKIASLNNKLETAEQKPKKEKLFKLPKKVNKLFKQENKKLDHVVVMYLTQKYQVRFKLAKIISGDLVVIGNKAHTLNPKCMWRYGKKMWYIVKEIDRKPVSNLDYDAIKERRDDTEADVPLIKAVLGAVQKQSNPLQNKNTWLIIGGAVVALIVLFRFLG